MGISFKRRGPKYNAMDQERVRAKIADAKVVERLVKGFMGEVELTQTQVAIGLKFMDKLVPNLQSVETEITQNTPFAVIPSQAKDAKAWEQSIAAKPIAPESPSEPRIASKAPARSPSTLKH
jgi:hypothetical protein